MLVLKVPVGGEATLEDPNVRTEAERLEYFLQEDHVRLYGRDLSKRVQYCGFACELLSADRLEIADQIRYSVRTPLYRDVFVCRRPE